MKSEQFEKIIAELKANMEELHEYRKLGTVDEVREAVNQVNIFKRSGPISPLLEPCEAEKQPEWKEKFMEQFMKVE